MPHSLRVKIKGLRYKGIITDKEYDRLCKALDNEGVLDKIEAEIEQKCCITVGRENDPAITLYDVFEIIDKYKAESEDK